MIDVNIATDGTLQRYTLSTAAAEQVADLSLNVDEALRAANDPDDTASHAGRPHLRAHVAGEVITVVDTTCDLIVAVRRAEPLDHEWACAA